MNWIDIKNVGFDYYLTYKIPRERGQIAPLIAAHNAINYIVKNYPAPYTLMLSGGVDSQAMLWAWHTSGVAYNTLSAIYNDNLNENDLCTLRQFSDLHNIKVNYYNFDLLNFLINEHKDYVFKYRCGSPHMTAFMKISEVIKKGTVIMSGNFFHIPDSLPISRNNFGLYRYSKIENRPMVPFFFCETQELAFSFTQKTKLDETKYVDSRVIDAVNNLGYHSKVQTYIDNEFPVIAQLYKLTGFELIKEIYDKDYTHQITIKDKLSKTWFQKSTRTFDILLRNKYELMFMDDKYCTIAVSEKHA